jgi:hypothetical protein
MVVVEDHQEWEPSMNEITTIGLDLAKNVFQVHGADATGTTVVPSITPSFPAKTSRIFILLTLRLRGWIEDN